MSETVIASILHGSHLFGTATESSDEDIKTVVMPSRRDILLGKVDWSTCETGMKSPDSGGGADFERHDLMRFTRLLAAGQPVAMEMLFAPAEFHRAAPHPIWRELQENSGRIASRASEKFLGYCRRQALVYGLKGERVSAAEKALAALDEAVLLDGRRVKLAPYIERVIAAADSGHVGLDHRTMPGGRVIAHLKIAGKMAAETVTLGEARDIAASVVSDYGERARKAKESNGKDWKALSHALRIGYEAVELFATGRITLPRPEAGRLLAVKRGEADADEVGDEITSLLDKVESAASDSSLREEPDMDFLDGIVIDAHSDAVAGEDCDMEAAPKP